MTTKTAAAVPAGASLMGEVITWQTANGNKFFQVRDALQAAGLDPKLCKDLSNKAAFSRAAKVLAVQRVIDKLDEDKDECRFQLTAREKRADSTGQLTVAYSWETLVTLRKETGEIRCTVQAIADAAKVALNQALEARTSGDVSKIVHEIFAASADIFPLSGHGGAYFVFAKDAATVDSVRNFLAPIGGRVFRLPVPNGTAEGAVTVGALVTEKLESAIEQHILAVKDFGMDTRPSTLEKCAERLKATKHKIETYRQYLTDKADELTAALEDAEKSLSEKVAHIGRLRDASGNADCDHCGHKNPIDLDVIDEGVNKFDVKCESCGQMFLVEVEEDAPTETAGAA